MTHTRRDLAHARDLRRGQTSAESLLWRHLRRRDLAGLKFRRPPPVGGYILDFFCEKATLAIELDGGGHADPAKVAYDARRTRRLEQLGIRILRFWNTDVLQNLDGVIARILEAAKSTPPSP